ncbi:Mbeg1-like protein [Piscirickettsia litoralis]|uniref:Fungal lipase-like domain-containing protein n=1 Tax=Piscirickettsia litoralis TaxID=1891921 RepID=A0ABX3A1U6_9GAMM|nr:Mbeg1-like protein [Piscirickettsia litoralis]ODN42202.1 hypothetical protein BGC07_03705 [Piscirickettsia litoralis]
MSEVTLSDLAFLANDVYLNPGKELASPKNASADRYRYLLENTETAINSDPHGPKANGFFARTYKYKQNGKEVLIVAYRGTSNTPDAYVDGDLASSNSLAQGQDAISFLFQVLVYAKEKNIDHKDIYITGHSLGGGLAQWISMLTVDQPMKFQLAEPTAFRTVAFNPPGMQKLAGKSAGFYEHYQQGQTYNQHEVKEAQEYMEFYNAAKTAQGSYANPQVARVVQEGMESMFSEKKLKHAAEIIKHYKREYGDPPKFFDVYNYESFKKLINHQMVYKNRQDALRMGQETMVFLWDMLFDNDQGGECFQELSNCYPHIYNFSAKYDLVHCSGFPAGNIINYDIDTTGQISIYWKPEHLILTSYFSVRRHIHKYQYDSAKTKLICKRLANYSDQSIDWTKLIENTVMTTTYSSVSPGRLLAKMSQVIPAAIYGGTAEHSMGNMLASIHKNTDLAQVAIGYDTVRTLINLGKKRNVYLYTTERHETLGRATQKNVVTYEQGYAKKSGGHAAPVYPYNQENYQTF